MYGLSGSLATINGQTKTLRGVYGSTIGSVNETTYVIGTTGLDDNNNDGYMYIERTGYVSLKGGEWNTNANGSGTSYSQASNTNYPAQSFAGADLRTGDKTVTLYVNWKKVVDKPTISGEFTYASGTTYNAKYSVTTGITKAGTYSATNAGTYTAKATPAAGYAWSNGTTTEVSGTWKINKKSIGIPDIIPKTYVYTGKTITAIINNNSDQTYFNQTGTTSAKAKGTYTVKWNLKDKTNTVWTDGTTTEKSVQWKIN